jgi:hypothetical protein
MFYGVGAKLVKCHRQGEDHSGRKAHRGSFNAESSTCRTAGTGLNGLRDDLDQGCTSPLFPREHIVSS